MQGARSAATEKTSEASFSEGSHRRSRCEVKRPEPTPRNTADGPSQEFFNSLLKLDQPERRMLPPASGSPPP